MNIKRLFLRSSLVTVLSMVLTFSLATCTFCPPQLNLCQQILGAPEAELTASTGPDVVFEEPGTLVAYHGSGCARSNKSGREDVLKVAQSLDLPGYVNNATVFLNGWRLKYLSKDHHVTGMGTMIGYITLEESTLKWQAAGVLSDKNFDDGYDWCYYYTLLGWNTAALDLTVDHDTSCDSSDPFQSNSFTTGNDGTTTALASFPSFLQLSNVRVRQPIAILPRGFGFAWPGCDDHHLLQAAYNLDHAESFIEHNKNYKKDEKDLVHPLADPASQVNAAYVSWETYAIYKDNKGRRSFEFAEIVSGLGGDDVGVIQPPFSILPVEDENFCTDVSSSPVSEDFVIENIPFDFAVPMLTGWQLNYGCEGDQHITEAGVWIDSWNYDQTTRTLRYTLSSNWRDKNGEPPYSRRHKVTILGLRAVGGTPPDGTPQ